MNEPIWKLMPRLPMQEADVVWREWPDGRQESCLVTTAEYLKWLADGNEPLPADVPPAPPAPPPNFTSLEYLDLFTEAEQLAVATAAMSSAPVKLWYDRMLAASFVTLADPRTEGGLNALAAAGLLTAARKAEIVAAMA